MARLRPDALSRDLWHGVHTGPIQLHRVMTPDWNNQRQTQGLIASFFVVLCVVMGISWQYRHTQSDDLLQQWNQVRCRIMDAPESTTHIIAMGSSLVRHALPTQVTCNNDLQIHRMSTVGLHYAPWRRSGVLDSLIHRCPGCHFLIQADVPFLNDGFDADAPIGDVDWFAETWNHKWVMPFQYELWAIKNWLMLGVHHPSKTWIQNQGLSSKQTHPRPQSPHRRPKGDDEQRNHFLEWTHRAQESGAQIVLTQIYRSPNSTLPVTAWDDIDFNGLVTVEVGKQLGWECYLDVAHANAQGRQEMTKEICQILDTLIVR